MADNIVGGLFGIDPSALTQQRMSQDLKEGYQLAQLDPMERAVAGIYAGSKQFGRAAQGLLGIEDPQLSAAKEAQSIMGQFDPTTSQGLKGLTDALLQRSRETNNPVLGQMAQQAAAQYQKTLLNEANVYQKGGENMSSLVAGAKYTPESLGVYQRTRNPADLVLADKGLTGANKEKVAAAIEANTLIESGTGEIRNYRDMIKNGEVQYGPMKNLAAKASAAYGTPTENALKQQEIESFITGQINEVLNAAKGVQAKDDALRAERQIKGFLAQNSSAGMDKALELLEKTKNRVKEGNNAYIASLTGETPAKAPKAPTGGGMSNLAVYETVRSKPGWEDATDEEIDAAVKAGKIKTGKTTGKK